MTFDKKDAEAKFDNFLMVMDEQLDWLRDEAGKRGIELDGSIEDASRIENLFDQMTEGRDKDYVSGLTVTFARWLGEIVRGQYGASWTLPLNDKKSVHFNTPVLVGHSPVDGVEFAPTLVMRAYALRRSRGTLRRAIESQIDPKALDLSKLEAEERTNRR